MQWARGNLDMRQGTFRVVSVCCAFLCVGLTLSFTSCGGDGSSAQASDGGTGNTDGGGGGSGGSDAGTGGTDAGTGGADAGSNGTKGSACQQPLDCNRPLVCDPNRKVCSDTVACTALGDCGKGAYCVMTTGKCAASVSGNVCASTDNCIGSETCNAGYCGCGGQTHTGTPSTVVPNVTILLDRSVSMDDCLLTEPGCTTDKWGHAQAAVRDVLAANKSAIRFGFGLFPNRNITNCNFTSRFWDPGRVFVYPGEGTDAHIAEINTSVSSAVLCNWTPIGDTLNALADDAALWDGSRPNHILLLTDGEHNGSFNPVTAAGNLLKHVPPAKTFVIGFDTGASATLSAIAAAGGTGDFYSASSVADLSAAFDTIAGSVLGCSYTLSTPPVNPTEVSVYANKTRVARDTTHTNGWDYSDTVRYTQIEFYGAACAMLQGGSVNSITIVFGCAYE